jgi:asparagine synthase (glutamine-hydrolysing)
MCGIFGIAMRPGGTVDERALRRMGDALGHRGPDERDQWSDGVVGLGATRLAIIDLATGQQPVSNEDGRIVAVQNGELYNYRFLRAELSARGHAFRAEGDTELLPHLYEEMGVDFPLRLRGMFAVALWDADRGRLVLARDRMGIKPLFWAESPDGLLFASEIKAILAAGWAKELDRQALHDYLSLDYVPGERTMFAGIHRLGPGERLVWRAGQPRAMATHHTRWWSLPAQESPLPEPPPLGQPGAGGGSSASPLSGSSAGEPSALSPDSPPGLVGEVVGPMPDTLDGLTTGLRDRLRDAVAATMVSDVPVGAFLSGGLDSSLVVALMAELTDRPVRTFTIGFEEASYDERHWARQVAERFGTEHHELVVRPDPEAMLDAMVDTYDEPFADSSAIATWAVSELASREVKVVLSGDGGDELCGGYVIYQADRLAAALRTLPDAPTRAALKALARLVPASDAKMSLDLKLRRFAAGVGRDPATAHLAWREIFAEAGKTALYADPEAFQTHGLRPTHALFREAFEAAAPADPLNRLMALDLALSLPDDMLTKVDRASMAHGLEVRVPLLDQAVVDYMARVPDRYKVRPIHRGLGLKWLLRRVARDLLPDEIIDRPKAGFHVPVPAWLKGPLRPMVERELGREAVARRGILDPEAVAAIVEANQAGRENLSRNVWGLLVFARWYDRHFGG